MLIVILGRLLLLVVIVAAANDHSRNDSRNDSTTLLKDEDSANLHYWKSRWEAQNTRWHKSYVHPFFQIPAVRKVLEDDPTLERLRVLIPLCGKSLDMRYLAEHDRVIQVVGVDGIQQALTEFQRENPQLELQDPVEGSRYSEMTGKGLRLLKGDFFDLRASDTEGLFDLIYDRGGLVALDPNLRRKYVDVVDQMLRPGGYLLLVVAEHLSESEQGPPFHVNEDDLRNILYPSFKGYTVTRLEDAIYRLSPRQIQEVGYLVHKQNLPSNPSKIIHMDRASRVDDDGEL